MDYEQKVQELSQSVIDSAEGDDNFAIIGAVAQNLIQYLVDTVD